jgi:sigma-B regulation protein RsbU (phosphoserine phosphatase)
VTAFFGILHSETHRLEYQSAGQGPILFYSHSNGTIDELPIPGFPLGIAPGVLFGTSEEVAFARGDILALVTDGFFEWFNNAGECFGIERTKAQLARDRDQPAAEIIRRLHAAVLDFAAGAPQPDDLSAVMIKRRS